MMLVIRELFRSLALQLGVFVSCVLFILITIPVYVYRVLVISVAKFVRPDLSVMHPRSSILAQTDSLDNPQSTIVIQTLFDGQIPYKEFCDVFRSRVLDAKLKCGKLRYPELRQYMVDWMGFVFFRDIHDFKLEDYVNLHESDKNLNSKKGDLDQICQCLLTKPFDKTKSPWEIVIVNGVINSASTSKETAIILRASHFLGDGYSWLKMLMVLLQNEYETRLNSTPKYHLKPNPKDNYTACESYVNPRFWVAIWRELTNVAATALDSRSMWKVASRFKAGKYSMGKFRKPIDVNMVKKVKELGKVRFSSVIYAAIAGAVRKMGLKRKDILPPFVKCILPIPMPGHPDGLANH
jgi:hypothetical protein